MWKLETLALLWFWIHGLITWLTWLVLIKNELACVAIETFIGAWWSARSETRTPRWTNKRSKVMVHSISYLPWGQCIVTHQEDVSHAERRSTGLWESHTHPRTFIKNPSSFNRFQQSRVARHDVINTTNKCEENARRGHVMKTADGWLCIS